MRKTTHTIAFYKTEIIWADRNEMARTVDDVLSRRVRILFLDAKATLEITSIVAKIVAKELNKDSTWEKQQIKEFTKIAKQYVLN